MDLSYIIIFHNIALVIFNNYISFYYMLTKEEKWFWILNKTINQNIFKNAISRTGQRAIITFL